MKQPKFTISRQKAGVLFLCWCFLVLFLAGAWTIAVLLDFDVSDGLFAYDSVLAKVVSISTLFSALSVCFWLFPSVEYGCTDARSGIALRVIAGIVSASMLAYCVQSLVYITAGGMLEKLSLLFSALSFCYFLLIAVRYFTNALPLLAFAPIGFAATYLLIIYFDMTQPLSGEMRIFEQMALLSVLLFMLCDVRLYLGRCSARLCLSVGVLSMVLAVPYAVSTIALAASYGVPLVRLFVACFVLVYAIYAGVTAWGRCLCARETEEADV